MKRFTGVGGRLVWGLSDAVNRVEVTGNKGPAVGGLDRDRRASN